VRAFHARSALTSLEVSKDNPLQCSDNCNGDTR
jgi:hypothetical protein